MPKQRQSELIQCNHFQWLLTRRHGVYHADGRSNSINPGRHSLGTRDRAEALQNLARLDAVRAAALKLVVPQAPPTADSHVLLTLTEGRRLYEEHLGRPRVLGGARESTRKRYRAIFDKFLDFANRNGLVHWNDVTAKALQDYLTHLNDTGYAPKTLSNEATVLKQTFKWLAAERFFTGAEAIRLKIRKPESRRAYCYSRDQVTAMIGHCRSRAGLDWLADVITALARTGLRISELASLRWTDLDGKSQQLMLTDESGRPRTKGEKARELKSGRSRSLPIHPDLAAVLSRLPRADRHVFHGPRGGRLKPDTVRRILVRDVIKPLTALFGAADGEQSFEDGRLHSFRHFFASDCANSNIPERIVKEWLGHQDSEMVRHYFHLQDAESRRQMERLPAMSTAGVRSAGNDDQAAGSVLVQETAGQDSA